MVKTKKVKVDEMTICVARDRLPELLGCGQSTADRISREAGARIRVGKRVLIKLDKLNAYLEQIVE